jgi:hypothetical protein
MQTASLKPGYIILFMLLPVISGNSYSQEKALSKQERKDHRKSEELASFARLDSLLNSRRFVLEADFLLTRYGEKINVLSNLNFVKVTNDHGVLQTGSASELGYNGVGGITDEGTIEKWQITRNLKKSSFYVRFNIISINGNYEIAMRVSANNHASATISGSISGSLTWDGRLESSENSGAFKGHNTY